MRHSRVSSATFTPRCGVNVLRLVHAAALGPLVEAGRAEGLDFMRRLQLELSAGDFGKSGAALFGSFSGTELVGVGGLTADPYPDAQPGVGRLRHLYVSPRCRRQGVGKALVLVVLKEARQHYRKLRLRTDTAAAARFYETLGFVPVSECNATHKLNLFR